MESFALAAAAFFLAIFILIFVHEWGHFKAARLCGVRVKRFSIGLGAPIFSKTDRLGTEWAIGWAPIGGYVKMVDGREGPLAPGEEAVAFDRQPLSSRFFIVIAGPLANLVFALLAFSAVFMIGVPEPKAFLGAPTPGTPAFSAGFTPREQIINIQGNQILSLSDAQLALAEGAILRKTLSIETENSKTHERRLRSLVLDSFLLPASGDLLSALGWSMPGAQVPPKIGKVEPDSPAKTAGLLPGDLILSVNGKDIEYWSEMRSIIQSGGAIPAALRVLGTDGAERSLSVTPRLDATKRPLIGVTLDMPQASERPEMTLVRRDFIPSLVKSAERCWSLGKMTFAALGDIFFGPQKASSAVAGPVGIAQQAGHAAGAGIVVFLAFLGFLSFSLFLMNMLPIPVLDGGYLLFCLIEFVCRRPLSEKAQGMLTQTGAYLLIGLLVFVMFNDISKLLH